MNSSYKIRRASSTLIETYVIDFQSRCENWLGCELTPVQYKAAFTYFVQHGKAY
jgi:hypothetical protein